MPFASLKSRGGVAALLFAISVPTLAACGVFSDPGMIVHAVGEEGHRDIAVVRPDGTEPRTVVSSEADDFAPAWSPSRQRIAYLSDRDGNVELYVSSADGSHTLRVTNTGVPESQPTWSPDGRRIAYTSPDQDGRPRVYWVSLADLIPNRLQFGGESDTDPAWSPQGTWIAFAALDDEGNSLGLFLRNPDGVNQLRISESPDRSPAWSPDGKKLAFVRGICEAREGDSPGGDGSHIYVLTVGEEGPIGQAQQVTGSAACDFAPEWSPDGRRLAFITDRNGGNDIYTVSDRGEDLRWLTRNELQELAVSWGPDGRIVFESQPSGKSDLFVMDVNGEQQILTRTDAPSTQPDW